MIFQKRKFILLLLLVFTFSLMANSRGRFKTIGPNINNVGDFSYQKDSIKVFEFQFTNVGDSLYTIQQIIPTCPCMTVAWKEGGLAPGDTGWIRVSYSADGPGHFRKMLTVLGDGFPEWDYIYVEGNAVAQSHE